MRAVEIDADERSRPRYAPLGSMPVSEARGWSNTERVGAGAQAVFRHDVIALYVMVYRTLYACAPSAIAAPGGRNRRFPVPSLWLPRERHIQRRPEMRNRARTARIYPHASAAVGSDRIRIIAGIQMAPIYNCVRSRGVRLCVPADLPLKWYRVSVIRCDGILTCEGGVLFVDETLVPVYSS